MGIPIWAESGNTWARPTGTCRIIKRRPAQCGSWERSGPFRRARAWSKAATFLTWQPTEAKKRQNFANRRTLDPEAKCYLPGIPRANYMPYPFQIVQSPRGILFVYEYATANRMVNMGKAQEAGSDTWMGTNNGHWEGDTLVVDVNRTERLGVVRSRGRFRQQQAPRGGALHAPGSLSPQLLRLRLKIRRSSRDRGRSVCRCTREMEKKRSTAGVQMRGARRKNFCTVNLRNNLSG